MNAMVVAIVTMGFSAIGAVITALNGWFRWSATRLSQRRVRITSSDGQVEFCAARRVSDAELAELTANIRALRPVHEEDSDALTGDHGTPGAGGTVSD